MNRLLCKPSKVPCFSKEHFRELSSITGLELISIFSEPTVLQNFLIWCARSKLSQQGMMCHARIIELGLQEDLWISNVLINLYSKSADPHHARLVFERMSTRSIVSWNTIIVTLIRHGEEQEALGLLPNMQREGIMPSEVTLSSVLCACGSKLAIKEGKQLHAYSIKFAFFSNIFVGTATLDFYSKCKLIKDAMQILDSIQTKNEVTWSSMIMGFLQNEFYEEALSLFHETQKLGCKCDQFTLSAVVSACASLAAPIEGNQVHSFLVKSGYLANLHVSTSLVHMYSRCGAIERAYVVFASAVDKNTAMWNAIISGFAKHARCIEAMVLFEKMQQAGLSPNEITYISVLSACSHRGYVKEGLAYFNLMAKDMNVKANVHHYSCMVDLLSRSGSLQVARELVETMPFQVIASVWGSLLGSSKVYGDLGTAEIASRHLLDLEPYNAGNQVLLSNLYAANKKWSDVIQMRKLLKYSGKAKEAGMSWIEVKGKVHTFVAGEASHPRIHEIYAKLMDLDVHVKIWTYKTGLQDYIDDLENAQAENLSTCHSEKLAFAFGIISLPSGAPIIIKKNLRICSECHHFFRFVSEGMQCLIIVRDTNRFHHFADGLCSCLDFW